MSVLHSVVTVPSSWTETAYTPAVSEERTEYVGATLDVGSETVQVMSDVWETARYALVWDATTQKPKKIQWIISGAEDATPEVVQAYIDYLTDVEFKGLVYEAESKAKVPEVGDTVKVIRGRKNFGFEGVLTHIISRPDQFSYRGGNVTLGAIPLDDEHEVIQTKSGSSWKKYKNVAWIKTEYLERTEARVINYVELAERARDTVLREKRNILKGLGVNI